jgi:hypothetical protein
VDRRTFLTRAGLAAAATGVAAAVPLSGVAAAAADDADTAVDEPDDAVVAHVRNVATGEIAVFTGTNEVSIHDRKLAAGLARAAKGAS